MPLENYYEPFYVQEFATKPSTLPPPWDKPQNVLSDGKMVMGLFRQDQSAEAMTADANSFATTGRFACDSAETFDSGAVLRRNKDGVYIQLAGTPLTSPDNAVTKVSTWAARVTSRGDIEQDTDE